MMLPTCDRERSVAVLERTTRTRTHHLPPFDVDRYDEVATNDSKPSLTIRHPRDGGKAIEDVLAASEDLLVGVDGEGTFETRFMLRRGEETRDLRKDKSVRRRVGVESGGRTLMSRSCSSTSIATKSPEAASRSCLACFGKREVRSFGSAVRLWRVAGRVREGGGAL